MKCSINRRRWKTTICYESDRPLREAVAREGGGWIEERALEFGALLGSAETLRLGSLVKTFKEISLNK